MLFRDNTKAKGHDGGSDDAELWQDVSRIDPLFEHKLARVALQTFDAFMSSFFVF